MSNPGADQIAASQQTEPPALEVAKRVLHEFGIAPLPRLWETHAEIRVVPVGGCDISEYEGQLREELGRIDWQFLTIPPEDGETGQREFAMAPITFRQVAVTYHTTRATTLDSIQGEGLRPSSEAIRHTDFPDTDGKIHVCESLTGYDGAAMWVKFFCGRYNAKPHDYGILRVDLTGLQARVYLDVRSQYGLIVDKIDRIPPERISFVRWGQEEDLAEGPSPMPREKL